MHSRKVCFCCVSSCVVQNNSVFAIVTKYVSPLKSETPPAPAPASSRNSSRSKQYLPETPGLTFPFKQTQNISFSDGSLDVSDNGSTSCATTFGIHKFDSDLSYVTGVSGSSQDAADLCEFDWGILRRDDKMRGSAKFSNDVHKTHPQGQQAVRCHPSQYLPTILTYHCC